MRKELKRLLADIRAAGFDVELQRGGHYKVRRGNATLYTFGSTPSDWRSLHNTRAGLVRVGVLR